MTLAAKLVVVVVFLLTSFLEICHKFIFQNKATDFCMRRCVCSIEFHLNVIGSFLAGQVEDPSMPNDEGITALHNAVCAGHTEIVKFLVQFGVNVNAADSDGW